jgi:hypothetical protein
MYNERYLRKVTPPSSRVANIRPIDKMPAVHIYILSLLGKTPISCPVHFIETILRNLIRAGTENKEEK